MSAYVHKGSPDSPIDIFSSTLSYECTATVCMGLVCSFTWLLGICSYGWCFHIPSTRSYLCTYIHSCKHTYSCASSALGLFLSPGQLTTSQSLSRICLAGYGVNVMVTGWVSSCTPSLRDVSTFPGLCPYCPKQDQFATCSVYSLWEGQEGL